MFKRKDNDIFGTADIGFAPRIVNDSYMDPNAQFKRKTEQNYEQYVNKLHNYSHIITGQSIDSSRVNEDANFQETYHKNRKELDLQSSIFYPPAAHTKPVHSNSSVQLEKKEENFGRKETLSREINSLPYNAKLPQRNASRLFDLDQRVSQIKTEQLMPLIPNQMQWNEHDSVRYAHINIPKVLEMKEPEKVKEAESLMSINESLSFVKSKENEEENANVKDKPKRPASKKVKSAVAIEAKAAEPVSITILRGWHNSMLQGLTKVAKLSGAAVIKLTFEEGGKGSIIIKRSQRWENVSDWLRKDAKLKIRVENPST